MSKKSKDKAGSLTQWGTRLLDKFSSQARNEQNRDASKRRQKPSAEEVSQGVEEMQPANIVPWAAGRTNRFDSSLATLTLAELEIRADLLSARVTPVWGAIKGHNDIEMANEIVTLLKRLVQEPCREDSIRLYQLFFTDYYTHFGTWNRLDAKWHEFGFAKSEFLYNFFLYWAEKAPDRMPIDAALFFLGRTNAKPPMELLLKLGSSHSLAVGSAAVIVKQYEADESALIRLAALHGFAVRERILSFLVEVKQPENKEWLLTDGYNSGADYHPCGYYAAVHGDLLSRLQADDVSFEMLGHYGRILADMCQAAGGSLTWKTIHDYTDAPETIERFFHLVSDLQAAKSMPSQLRDILRFISNETPQEDGEDTIWDAHQLTKIFSLGRALFSAPYFSRQEIANYLYWEQPPLTIENLQEQGIVVFYDVLELAIKSDDDNNLSDVISWAIDYLHLNAIEEEREQRKIDLLSERMPGVCSGGIAGIQDPGLGSIYGQVLLQIAQALEGYSPLGEPILLAALKTDYPHLPGIAAEMLRQWPQGHLSVEVQAVLRS